MSTVLGTTLSGRYRLEARIGAGGMSTVYRAVDETLERPVAIKLMNREVARDSDLLERFRREARAVAQLSHPNIVGVIDAGDDLDPDSPRPYIVFEYVEGETLKERIRREGRLPIPEGVAYSIEIARALGAAHKRNIVHRDVKPQNVLIDRQGSAKVTDFGIARTLDEDGLTADGRVLGTTDYVSPEQALGQHVNGQSDLYSLGIALYEMLTGEVPFKGENQVAVAMKHVREPLPDVRAKRPEVSAALASVVEKATAKTTRERYASDAELIADLEQVLAVETARAGGATGEATTVLQSLPKGTRRRVPFAIRHRVRTIAMRGGTAAFGRGRDRVARNAGPHRRYPRGPPPSSVPARPGQPDLGRGVQPRRTERRHHPEQRERAAGDRRRHHHGMGDPAVLLRGAPEARRRHLRHGARRRRSEADGAHDDPGLQRHHLRHQHSAGSEQLSREPLGQAGVDHVCRLDRAVRAHRRRSRGQPDQLQLLPRVDHEAAAAAAVGEYQRDQTVRSEQLRVAERHPVSTRRSPAPTSGPVSRTRPSA